MTGQPSTPEDVIEQVAGLAAAREAYPRDFASEGDRHGFRVVFLAGWLARAAAEHKHYVRRIR